MPLVSIIVPVFKVEQYLDKCVKSLIGQTLEDIEIILVDDGSPDNCPQMCDAWAMKDKRIRVIHKENGGLSSARNAALEIFRGEFVGFVDSDDYVAADMFEALYRGAVQSGSDIAICAHYQVSGEKATEHFLPYKKNVYEKEEIANNFILPLIGKDSSKPVPSIEGFVWRQLFRKDVIENVFFRSEKEYFAEDVVFDLDVYPRCNRVAVVNKPLYYYRYNEQSLSNKYRNKLWEKFHRLLALKQSVAAQYHGVETVHIRMENATVFCVVIAVLNLAKSECPLSFQEKKRELKAICSDAQAVLQKDVIKRQNKKTKLMLLLLKAKCFTVLLMILRARK